MHEQTLPFHWQWDPGTKPNTCLEAISCCSILGLLVTICTTCSSINKLCIFPHWTDCVLKCGSNGGFISYVRFCKTQHLGKNQSSKHSLRGIANLFSFGRRSGRRTKTEQDRRKIRTENINCGYFMLLYNDFSRLCFGTHNFIKHGLLNK